MKSRFRRTPYDESNVDLRLLVDIMLEFEYRAQQEIDEADKGRDDADRFRMNTNKYYEALKDIVKKHPEVQKEWEAKEKEIRGW